MSQFLALENSSLKMFTYVFYALVHIPLFFCRSPAARASEGRGWQACQEQPGDSRGTAGKWRSGRGWTAGRCCCRVRCSQTLRFSKRIPKTSFLCKISWCFNVGNGFTCLKNHYVYLTKINLQIVSMGCQLRLPNNCFQWHYFRISKLFLLSVYEPLPSFLILYFTTKYIKVWLWWAKRNITLRVQTILLVVLFPFHFYSFLPPSFFSEKLFSSLAYTNAWYMITLRVWIIFKNDFDKNP